LRWNTDDTFAWKAKRLRKWRRQRLLKKIGLLVAFLAAYGAAWNYLPESMNLPNIYKQWAHERQDRKSSVYYRNCDAAREDGAAPIRIGEPGYRPALDADHDGIACEPIPPWAR
jgi:hypothetical protein